jgi:Protein of unknown function (DUF2516)
LVSPGDAGKAAIPARATLERVPSPFLIESQILLGLFWILLAVKVFALADAVIRRDALYVAADKQNKAFWLLILAVFLILHIIQPSPLFILNMIGTIAACIYLADVRPALRELSQH